MGISIQQTCLNPNFGLRTQMFLSFGTTAIVALSTFMLIGMYTILNSGESVRTEAANALDKAIRHSLGKSAQYVAETMTRKFENFGGAGNILAQATMDRFVGYQNMTGWKTDDYVPFQDTLTGLQIYPIDAEPLPLEWNITANINEDNYEEHMPNRPLDWYPTETSSTNAMYFMQGVCDPSVQDPNDPKYYPDCTEQNNNLLEGGVVYPTDTNYYIANKAKDLSWILKPIYESHPDLNSAGLFFANDGAGSVVKYPASISDGRLNFTSIGCGWMKIVNPLNNRSVGTDEQIERCNRAGEIHPWRRYNPLERGWCRGQVLNDIAVHEGRITREHANLMSEGPYQARGFWFMTFGRAVWDRLTHEFIACVLLDVSVNVLYDILKESTSTVSHYKDQQTMTSALIRWDHKGTVVVASEWNPRNHTTSTNVTDPALGLGLDAHGYNQIRQLVDYDTVWDPDEVMTKYQNTIIRSGGRSIMSHPVPTVPPKYDEGYLPIYFVIESIEDEEAYLVLTQMESLIEEGLQESARDILIAGGVGFAVVALSIAFISSTLTKPLRWMQKVAGDIVDNAGGHDLSMGLPDEKDAAEAQPFCSPRTEVTLLLSEFIKMINDFSGQGAAEVAGAGVNEVKNKFEWKKMYRDLYPWGDDSDSESVGPDGFPNQVSVPTDTTVDTFEDDLTLRSTASIFSLLSASLPAALAPVLENAVAKTTTLLTSVKEYAVSAGTKAGVFVAEPEPENVEGPPKVHCGENLQHPPAPTNDYFDGAEAADNSYLFWWTTFFIGTPIVVAALIISLTVAKDIRENMPLWMDAVERKVIDLEISALIAATKTRAVFGEEVMHRFSRDLHILTRVAGWLLLGSLGRADSITFQATGNEQCKFYDKERNSMCPYNENDTLTPCLCEWDDPWPGRICTNLSELSEAEDNPFSTSPNTSFLRNHPRYWQHRWYIGSSSDADEYGNRFSTSFPEIDYWANTTHWWNDTSTMPGAYKGSNASGYQTTYDRVRALSALSVADFPIYNYLQSKRRILGTYVGLEADGMFMGFSGCDNKAETYLFRSDDGNNANKFNSTLCPLGKYGYDSRCRGWYVDSFAENGFTHVTSPYTFYTGNTVGMSAGAALIDPKTRENLGVTLIDFSPDAFTEKVRAVNTAIGHGGGGFPIIITATQDKKGFDTIVGPGFKEGKDKAAIGDVVLPNDSANSTNRIYFEEHVAERMRNGTEYYSHFTRTMSNGEQQEIYITYSPVRMRSLRAVDHSDFSAGVEAKEAPVYALGFGIPLKDLEIPFEEVQLVVSHDTQQAYSVSFALIIGAVLMVMYMTYTMTLYLAQPILCLVGIVKSIADKTLTDEIPKLTGGSCEIHDVYDSLEKLCKIVRFSNAAFFKGNRTKGYKVLQEALELFMKMGNQKALGVANNNLGTMVLQEQMEKSSITAQSEEVLLAGMKYFDEAIRIAIFEYQNAEFDDSRGEFVKQLANRYFNRGMFYIVNRKHPKAAFNLEEGGRSDLERARSLDQEAYLTWRERGQIVGQAKNEFFCILRRARGILTLIQETGFEDVWGIDDLIAKAHDMIHNPAFSESALFENVNMIARKQQVDDLRIQYALSKGETEEAAKIAMRILVEDEYVIDTVLMNCVTTVNKHYDLHNDDPNQLPNLAEGLKRETRRGQVDSMRVAKNVIFCLDYSGSMAGERMQRANGNMLWMYEEHCLDKDHVGFLRFNHAVDERIYFDLERKGGRQEEHEAILRQALDAEGGTRLYAALNKCVTMSLGSGNSFDTWIIALTDGESAWDFPAAQVIKRIEANNRKEGPKIHVIIIGFEVPPEVADSVAIITQITDKSLYIDAKGGLEEMDNAFERVASVITGTAITLETF